MRHFDQIEQKNKQLFSNTVDIQQEVLYNEKEQQFSIIAVCLVFLT
jgi:hypothetical protein